MRILVTFLLLFCFLEVNATWGVTGHRVVGDIAENHLTPKARKKIRKILGSKSIAYYSTWMDEIRSDSLFNHTHDWHWVTIPDNSTYEEAEKNPNGDIIQTLTRLIKEIETETLNKETEARHLKMIIHLIGDIHQPLHVGNGLDQGGNQVRVKYFGSSTNLHSVWDSRMIDGSRYSYTELSHELNTSTKVAIESLQSTSVLDWAYESRDLRKLIYDIPENGNISYEYVYRKYYIVEKRLLEAGIRLAGLLNKLYG